MKLTTGLKIMVVCFDKFLSGEWKRVVWCLKEMDGREEGGLALWDFLDFAVSYRSPLSHHIAPFALQKVRRGVKSSYI